jgi:hypothetical protein
MLRLLESYIMRYGGPSAISVAAADKPHWLLPREPSVISSTRNMQTLDMHRYEFRGRLGMTLTLDLHLFPRHTPGALVSV